MNNTNKDSPMYTKMDVMRAFLEGTEVHEPSRNSVPVENYGDIFAKMNKFDELKATEITVTFMPQLHDNWHEESLKGFLEESIRKILKKAPEYAQMLLIGEHSPVGRFHYHGMLQNIPNDFVAKLRRNLTRQIGRIEIKQIKYFDSYKAYMFKSYTDYKPEQWRNYSYIKINI